MEESGNGAIPGLNYTLECGVSWHELLIDARITYEWTRGSSSVVLGGDMTYTFNTTVEDDGVMYHCAATVTSRSLYFPITGNGSRTISVLGIIISCMDYAILQCIHYCPYGHVTVTSAPIIGHRV